MNEWINKAWRWWLLLKLPAATASTATPWHETGQAHQSAHNTRTKITISSRLHSSILFQPISSSSRRGRRRRRRGVDWRREKRGRGKSISVQCSAASLTHSHAHSSLFCFCFWSRLVSKLIPASHLPTETEMQQN